MSSAGRDVKTYAPEHDQEVAGLSTRRVQVALHDQPALESSASNLTIDSHRGVSISVNIWSLPQEILLMIFILCRDIPPPWDSGWVYGLGWAIITHVCHSWRRLAIGHPLLWINIPSSVGPRWVEELLKRSRTAAINLYISKYSHLQPAGAEFLCHMHRAKSIRLMVEIKVAQQFLDSFDHHAPLLELLIIKIVDHTSPEDKLSFPQSLSGGHAPHLRSLHLTGCNLPGTLSVFRGLTTLDIRHTRPWVEYPAPTSNPQVSLTELLDFLDNTPALVSLEAEEAFTPQQGDIERLNKRPKVPLSDLRYLEIRGGADECHFLMRGLHITPTCEICLNAEEGGPRSLDTLYGAMFELVRYCFIRPKPFTHVDIVPESELRIAFNPEFFHPPNIWWHSHCRITLSSLSDSPQKVYGTLLHWLFQVLPGIQSIALEQGEHDVLTAMDLVHAMCRGDLDSVHTVRLAFDPVGAFPEFSSFAQMERATLLTGEVVEGPMLPGLQTLVIGDNEPCEWGETCKLNGEGEREERIRNPGIGGALADLVRGRTKLQVPLERLVIKGYWKMERAFMDSLLANVGDEVRIEETFLEHEDSGLSCCHLSGIYGVICTGK